MTKQITRNIRLGLMVVSGLVLLIAALYFIGSKQNLFGPTVKFNANFTNINGLAVGNNVRYMGIDVGTVSKIEIINDSLVLVEMTVEKDATAFIRKNAIARIGTDGLMGNKLVNIDAVKGKADYIAQGDIIKTIAPLETDQIFRTLSETNDDIYLIAENLKSITSKFEEENMIWNLLSDTLISKNIKNAMKNIESTTVELNYLTHEFNSITSKVQKGEGLVGALLFDTAFVNKFDQTMANIREFSDSLTNLSGDISRITERVNRGDGAIGTLLKDENFDENLRESIKNIKSASDALDENMEALKHNFLFRRYFKKQEKNEKKEKKNDGLRKKN